jgi:murein DD-endopeptidase MepM/ murein hydrolase activator NlpD
MNKKNIVMNEYSTLYPAYPVKIISRTATLSRLRKLRISWLAAGMAFSIGCTSSLTPIFGSYGLIASIKVPFTLSAAKEPAVAAESTNSNLQASAPLEDIIGAAPEEAPIPALVNPLTLANIVNQAPADTVPAPSVRDLKVKKGDTIISLLTDAGISYEDAQNTFSAIRKTFNPRRLDVGSVITVHVEDDGNGNTIVRKLKLPVSSYSTIELSRTQDDRFDVKTTTVPLIKKLARAGGTIDSSIYQTGADYNIPAAMLNEIVNAYSYDVDFQRDIKKGDSIDVLYERMETKDGQVASNGNFVFSELNLGGRVLKIFRYTDKNGNSDFYNEKGESIRKALMKTPINGARITSGYGMRNHPISGYTKMHRGIDFGAPIGTPIYAAGDGVVQAASVRNGYGNYLKIKHNSQYSSAYAHLSRYASGIAPGKHVKQGQIVAYVGMTGAATGPHLHYEILVNNVQVNPANVKFKTGTVLQGKELVAFRENMNKIEARLASISRGNTVAMVDEEKRKITD